MKTNKKRLALLDHCLPDYFRGYHKPVISIPIFGTMNNLEISDAIQSKANYIWDYLTDVNGFNEDELTQFIDSYCNELKTKPNDIFVECEGLADGQEPSYLYFSIIDPVYKYGIMFLNP